MTSFDSHLETSESPSGWLMRMLVYSSGRATCVKFGPDANYVAVGSRDRNLRIFGLPGEDKANADDDSAQDS